MDDQNSDIDSLIGQCLSGNASPQEMRELEEWLKASSQNRKLYGYIKEVWLMTHTEGHDENSVETIRDRIWAEGTGKELQRGGENPFPKTILYWSKVAAIFLFLVGTWQLFLFLKESPEIKETVAVVTKVTQSGQRSVHLLPDGTKIWLNGGSSLFYPEAFADTVRWVRLEGEAFFDVAKDLKKPIVVEAADTQTQVLGTAFNVKAYPEDQEIKISLLEGKVQVHDTKKVESVLLLPGEEILADKETGMFTKHQFKHEQTFGWKDGILLFDGVDFDEFKKAIAQWYGVEVIVKGAAPKNWNIRARYHQESLQHVLTDISFNKNMQFVIEDKKITITFL